MLQKDRILWIEGLRVIACLAVTILHVGSMRLHSVPVNTFKRQAFNFWCSITRFAVPVFL